MEKGDKKGNAFLVYELLGISDVLVLFCLCAHGCMFIIILKFTVGTEFIFGAWLL